MRAGNGRAQGAGQIDATHWREPGTEVRRGRAGLYCGTGRPSDAGQAGAHMLMRTLVVYRPIHAAIFEEALADVARCEFELFSYNQTENVEPVPVWQRYRVLATLTP
jgi:hypothetical protein